MTTSEALFETFETALESGEDDAARRALDTLRAQFSETRDRSLAEINWRWSAGEEDGPIEASDLALRADAHGSLLGWLESHAEGWPEDADVRYELGALYLELDREADARPHWLAVLEQDARDDEDQDLGNDEDAQVVAAVAEQTLAGLPETFGALLSAVPVMVEARPERELVAQGFDPRAYGLFEGPTQAEADGFEPPAAPTRIVLFVANLVADFPEPEQLELQVQITILHEVGHYFGLEEDDMERLGWD